MIIGEPFDFAIGIDVVDSWNEEEQCVWVNGIFTMYVGGVRLPPRLDVAELRTSIGTYIGRDFGSFKEQKTDLFISTQLSSIIKKYITQKLTKKEKLLFETEKVIPLSCTVMEDQNCWVFLMKSANDEESIVWTLDDGNKILRHSLPIGTVENVISILSVDLLL